MFLKIMFWCACTFFIFTDTAFVNTIAKCSIKDDKCLKSAYGNVISSIGTTGIPEYGIPPIDPIVLKDITLSIANLLDVTLLEGTVSGISGCRYNSFHVDIEKGRGNNEVVCDLTIEGKYRANSSSPLIKTVLNGSSIYGEGNGKVSLENFVVKLDFPFHAQKHDDGEIYLKCDYKSAIYSYDVLGKVKFEADKLYLGEKEASNVILPMLNENWKFIITSFGKPFVSKALDLYVDYSSRFFDVVPARQFITDDLSPYARS